MYLLIRHKVKDFSQWKEAYDSRFQERARTGLSERHLFTSTSDPHDVIILFEVKDRDRAKDFVGSPELRESMERAGVMDRPDIYFLQDHSGSAVMDEVEELKRLEEVYTDRPDKEVAIEFIHNAPEAEKVFLAGTFNNWDSGALPMKKNRKGQWRTILHLLPGRYEYKYVVDGSWVLDRRCGEVTSDDQDSANCVIDVTPKMAA